MHCQSCEVLFINGVKCHETGCPDAWKDKMYECAWCGREFEPEERSQKCCDQTCVRAFYGLPAAEDE